MIAEKWYDSYDNDPLVYDRFSSYEDFGGKVLSKLIELLPLKGSKILDIGCGTGKYVKALSPLVTTYFALDKSADMLRVTKAKCKSFDNVTFINANSSSIPLKDNSIDVVLSTWGLGSRVLPETMKEVARLI